MGPFAHLNLGDHVGDEAAAVAANRARLRREVGARPVFLQQVHGTRHVELDASTPDGECADASLARIPGVACTVMVADCLPVLLTDMRGTCVAAVHAGWRGLAAGVLQQTVAACRSGAPSGNAEIMAWLGPCIGPRVFEVGHDVREAFTAIDTAAERHFQPAAASGKWLADLPGLARRQLGALGVVRVFGNDGTDAWCTVSNPSRFFSYRRDGVSGRFAALVWLV